MGARTKNKETTVKRLAFAVFVIALAAAALAQEAPAMALAAAAPAQEAPAMAPPPGAAPGGLMPGGGGSPQKTDVSWIKTKHLDLAYATASPAERLDLYLPDSGPGPFPLIIEIHGGGFLVGGKSEQIAPMLEGLKRGYAVASINYRLSGEAPFPAAVLDVKAAIRFLRANAAKYGLDPGRFATWGGSAGGNLSAMAALSAGVAKFNDASLGNAGVPDTVQAAVDWFGPLQFSTMDAEFAALGTSGVMGLTNSPTSAESRYLGKVVGTAEAAPLVEAASPLAYISSKAPPMCIQHGTAAMPRALDLLENHPVLPDGGRQLPREVH